MASTPLTYHERIAELQRFYNQHKRLPSYQEMLGLFNLKSKNSIYRFVQKLIEQHWLTQQKSGQLAPGSNLLGVPLLGRVEAGWPSPAEEELADAISIDDYLIGNKQSSVLLQVTGDSMLHAGIRPGDLVIVERGRTAKSGDIVIAQVDNDWTIKRYKKTGTRVELIPENPAYQPVIANEEMRVEGVVTGVIRKYK